MKHQKELYAILNPEKKLAAKKPEAFKYGTLATYLFDDDLVKSEATKHMGISEDELTVKLWVKTPHIASPGKTKM